MGRKRADGEDNTIELKTVRNLLRDWDTELLKSSPAVDRVLIIAVGLSAAIILAKTKKYENLPSARGIFSRIITDSSNTLFARARSLRKEINGEIRSLLRKGPNRYYQDALKELAGLQ